MMFIFFGMVSEEAFTKQSEVKYTVAAKDIKTKDYDCMLLYLPSKELLRQKLLDWIEDKK